MLHHFSRSLVALAPSSESSVVMKFYGCLPVAKMFMPTWCSEPTLWRHQCSYARGGGCAMSAREMNIVSFGPCTLYSTELPSKASGVFYASSFFAISFCWLLLYRGVNLKCA